MLGINPQTTYIDLSLELLHRLHGTRSNNDLTALNLPALYTTKQRTHVITCLAAIELLVERLCRQL